MATIQAQGGIKDLIYRVEFLEIDARVDEVLIFTRQQDSHRNASAGGQGCRCFSQLCEPHFDSLSIPLRLNLAFVAASLSSDES
jgi:hypothetical protein